MCFQVFVYNRKMISITVYMLQVEWVLLLAKKGVKQMNVQRCQRYRDEVSK